MLFAQDGHAPTSKVFDGMKEGFLSGVVLSPRSSNPEKLSELVTLLKGDHGEKSILLDPCFYVSSMGVSNTSKLTTHPYFKPQLTRKDFSAQNIQQYVKETIDYQVSLGLVELITPSYRISMFDDAGSQIAIQLFEESIRYVQSLDNASLRLYLCLFAHERAFSERESMDDFLDLVSTLETNGFYIVVERATSNAPQWSDPICLSSAIYLTYVLKENGFDIIWGFTDMVGAVLSVAGNIAIANGWFKNQRMFTRDMYLESTPKRQPPSKYTSGQLLNMITINPDMQSAYEVNLLEGLLSDSPFDDALRGGPASVTPSNDEICLQHWQVLERLLVEVDNGESIDQKIDILREKIDLARSSYAKLRLADIRLSGEAGPSHLDVWETALVAFKDGI